MEEDKESLSSKDDEHRVEMVWTTKIESHYFISVPTIIIPLTMSTVNQFFTQAESELINSVGYLVTGSLSGINTFLNLPSQYQQHYDCEARYDELAQVM